MGPLGTNFSKIQIKMHQLIFFQENVFKNVVCKISAILYSGPNVLTHWDWVMHICVNKLTIRQQPTIWTNAGLLLIWNLGTNLSEILSEIHIFKKKCIWKGGLRNGGHFVSASMF